MDDGPRGLEPLRDVDGVSEVVAVAVGHEQDVAGFDGVGAPRVDRGLPNQGSKAGSCRQLTRPPRTHGRTR